MLKFKVKTLKHTVGGCEKWGFEVSTTILYFGREISPGICWNAGIQWELMKAIETEKFRGSALAADIKKLKDAGFEIIEE